MSRPALACAALVAALLPAGCALDAQLETRTVCFTRQGTLIPAASGAGTVETDLAFDLGSDLPVVSQAGASYRLTLQSLGLSLEQGSGPADLGGLDELRLSVVAPPGSSLAEQPLIDYVQGADPHLRSLTATAETAVNLHPYIDQGQVTFHALARGTLPGKPWLADTQACFLLDMNVSGAAL